jgi:hypothetical protein
MERNRDLKEDEEEEVTLLRPRRLPLSDSRRNHTELYGHRSHLAMLCDPNEREGSGLFL